MMDQEGSVSAWVLDLVPECRRYRLVCTHPVALAAIARHLVHGQVEGARRGYRTVRTELAEWVPPHSVDAALSAYCGEAYRLAAAERTVDLVERALRGDTFTHSL